MLFACFAFAVCKMIRFRLDLDCKSQRGLTSPTSPDTRIQSIHIPLYVTSKITHLGMLTIMLATTMTKGFLCWLCCAILRSLPGKGSIQFHSLEFGRLKLPKPRRSSDRIATSLFPRSPTVNGAFHLVDYFERFGCFKTWLL